ncbi:MAG: hypothetical protein IT382_24930 [Deltaproteobacteria bacterium]|nr:hypothetical protein [Deltaproteobacteria bacterium]
MALSSSSARAALSCMLPALLLSACPAEPPPPPGVPAPDLYCPGGPGCSETLADDVLLAAAVKRVVTPTRFEIANARYLEGDRPNFCAPEAPRQGTEALCGELREEHLDDCGKDGVCPSDDAWVAADADGSERDGDDTDWFFDCGADRICPDNVPEPLELRDNGFDDDGDGAIDDADYPGPDEGEGDGVFQGLWIAGYGNSRPAMGVKDELSVRAVVLRQGDTTLALVTVDAVGIFYDEQVRMKEKLEAMRPGQVDALFVQASHTHEAPDTMGQWGYIDPYIGLQQGHGRSDQHMETLRSQGAQAVAEALDALVPVRVRVGQVHVGIEGLLSDGRDPKIFNDAVTAISLEEQGTDAVVATLVNWGNHPESLDSRNNFISADYLHAAREALEGGMEETASAPARPARGGVALYLQGAVGGIMGINSFPITGRDGTVYPNDQKTFARTDAYGENIAEHAFAALEQGEVLSATPLRFSVRVYRATVENQAFHVGINNGWFDRAVHDFDPSQPIFGDNLPKLETAVALVYLGDIAMVTAPGELFPETFVGFDPANSLGAVTIDEDNPNPPDLSLAPTEPPLRDKLGARFALPLGLCQDETGYLVEPYDFKLALQGPYIDEAEGDHYEETNSVGPQAVPLMMGALTDLFSFEAARAP